MVTSWLDRTELHRGKRKRSNHRSRGYCGTGRRCGGCWWPGGISDVALEGPDAAEPSRERVFVLHRRAPVSLAPPQRHEPHTSGAGVRRNRAGRSGTRLARNSRDSDPPRSNPRRSRRLTATVLQSPRGWRANRRASSCHSGAGHRWRVSDTDGQRPGAVVGWNRRHQPEARGQHERTSTPAPPMATVVLHRAARSWGIEGFCSLEDGRAIPLREWTQRRTDPPLRCRLPLLAGPILGRMGNPGARRAAPLRTGDLPRFDCVGYSLVFRRELRRHGALPSNLTEAIPRSHRTNPHS